MLEKIKFPGGVMFILAVAIAFSGPEETQLTTKTGRVLSGKVLSTSPREVVFDTGFGAVRIPVADLDSASVQKLKLGADANAIYYRQRVVELESETAALKSENQRLRKLLVARNAVPAEQPSSTAVSPQRPTGSAGGTGATNGSVGGVANYWISSAGKRHNSRCKYYKNCKGRGGTPKEGVACKICGG